MKFSYVSSIRIKSIFQDDPIEFDLRTIVVNGVKRGCNGFLTNTENGIVIYIDTEAYFNGGLFGDMNRSILFRIAASKKDYCGKGYRKYR